MKYIILALSLISTSAIAANCKLPKNCTYMDSEFSTGGGDKVSYVMEVTCAMPNEKIVKYNAWQVSIGSVFGVGRFTMPRKITLSKGNKDKLECKF